MKTLGKSKLYKNVTIIPKNVRTFLNIDIGDAILYIIDSDGNIYIKDAIIEYKKEGKKAQIIDISTLSGSKEFSQYYTSIPVDVKELLELKIDDNIEYIQDDGNILIKKSYI
jgi:bifunctional DNA-binding transcriptional regulator/antitoxin component of YhaV-PrlF toxin-antitoxin module